MATHRISEHSGGASGEGDHVNAARENGAVAREGLRREERQRGCRQCDADGDDHGGAPESGSGRQERRSRVGVQHAQEGAQSQDTTVNPRYKKPPRVRPRLSYLKGFLILRYIQQS